MSSTQDKDANSDQATLPETVQVLKTLQDEPWQYDFFATVRRLESGCDGPGFGRSLKPSDDPVRLGQWASMAFPPRSIYGVESGPRAPILKLCFSGLFGPNGALPDHYTERAEERRRHRHDNTLEAFADIFHHRFFSLFYRAWADTDPVLCLDKVDDRDYFNKFVSVFGGVYQIDAQEFSDYGRRYYMGHVAPSSARPEALERVLGDAFHVPVEIVEFVGTWVDVQEVDKACLGHSALADMPILGQAIWSRSSAFEIAIGPLDAEEYKHFLPGGRHTKSLRETVIALTGMDYDWHIRLKRKAETISGIKLDGGSMLGLDSWMQDARESDAIGSRSDMLISGERY